MKAFRERRDTVVKMMNEIPGVKCNTPAGAFYLLSVQAEGKKRMSGREYLIGHRAIAEKKIW